MKSTTIQPLACHAAFAQVSLSRYVHTALAGGLGYGVIMAFNTCAPLILQGRIWWGALMLNHFVAPTGRLTMMSWGVASLLVSQQAWPLALLCVALASGAFVCVARCRSDQNALRKISSI